MQCLIDGDIIKYQAGFASDQKIYTLAGNEFEYKKDAVFHAKTHNLSEDDIEVRVEAEPVEYCLSSVKKMMYSILEATDADTHRIFLTGDNNFRDKVAVTAPYKGNRDKSHKPTHFQAIHDYLVKHWDAEIIDGEEADDALGIAQYTALKEQLDQTDEVDPLDCSTVIATIDKDLNCIPGWHYNWRDNKIEFIDWDNSITFFYRQLLTGDTVDNILGCGIREETVYKSGKKKGQTYMKRRGVGPKEAEKLLPVGKSEEALYNNVIAKYKEYFKDEWEIKLREMADLLWIRREPYVSWQPPQEM